MIESAPSVGAAAGKVLTGLVGRIDKSLKAHPIGTPADIEAALPGLLA